jgi:hypothetical protein
MARPGICDKRRFEGPPEYRHNVNNENTEKQGIKK